MEAKKFRGLIILLGLSIMLSGGASLVNEFILGSLSSMILGSSFVQMALTIGIMLFGTGIGAMTQQKVSNKLLMLKFLRLEMILALVGGFSPILIYFAFANVEGQFIFLLNGIIFSLGFMIGFEIPLMIRILERYSPNLKGNLSLIFSLDYLGAFIGTLLWVYYLLSAFPFTETSFIVSGANFLVAVITFMYYFFNRVELEEFAYNKEKKDFEDKIKTIEVLDQDASWEKKELRELKKEDTSLSLIKYILIFTVVFGSLFYGYLNNRNWNISLEQKMYKDPIILSTTTKYQHLVVTENKKMGIYELYINGNTQFSSLDEHIYHDFLIHPVMAVSKVKKNVLIIGGGDGMAARELLKYKGSNITLIDLDKELDEIAAHNPIFRKMNKGSFDHLNYIEADGISSGDVKELKDDKNATYAMIDVINIDAEKFLHSLKGRTWDIIVIDLPDPSNPELVKLYSKQFYLSLKKVLSDNGMFVIQSTSPYHAKESFLCIGRTLDAAGLNIMPYHINVPSFGDWGYYVGWKNNDTKEDVKKRFKNVKAFNIDTSYITPELMNASFIFGKGALKTSRTEINEILYPKLLDIYTNNSWLTY